MLHPDEVAADKTLALLGRAAARDLGNVDALNRRYTRRELFALAAEKDPAFDPRMFADARCNLELSPAGNRPRPRTARRAITHLSGTRSSRTRAAR